MVSVCWSVGVFLFVGVRCGFCLSVGGFCVIRWLFLLVCTILLFLVDNIYIERDIDIYIYMNKYTHISTHISIHICEGYLFVSCVGLALNGGGVRSFMIIALEIIK